MSDDELKESFSRLKSPNLLENIIHDIGRSGFVGEPGHIASIISVCNSRICRDPLNLSPQGESGVGKSAAVCAVSNVFESVSLVSGYLSKTSLIHDTEWSEKEGDAYVINLMGKIIILLEAEESRDFLNLLKPIRSHDKKQISYKITEGTSGKHSVKKVIIKGYPVFVAISVNPSDRPEDSTRDLSITPHSSESKTKAVNLNSGKKSKNPWKYPTDNETDKINSEWDFCLTKYLKSGSVVIVWAEEMAKRFDARNPRSMRDFKKLISIMESITLLHQYQRVIIETKNGERYIFATIDDLRITSRLAKILIEPTTKGLGQEVTDLYDDFLKPFCQSPRSIKEIMEAYAAKYGRPITRSVLNEHYLYLLRDLGMLNQDDSGKTHLWSTSSVGLSESVGIDFDRLEKEVEIETGIREMIPELMSSVDVSRVLQGDNPIFDASRENIIQELVRSIQSATIRQDFLRKLESPLSSCLKHEDKISVGNEKTDADTSDTSSQAEKVDQAKEDSGQMTIDQLNAKYGEGFISELIKRGSIPAIGGRA